MKRNDSQSSAKGPVKTVEVPVPNPLSLDPTPSLGADLQASGHDIKDVGNIDCKTVNGLVIEDMVYNGDEGVKLYMEAGYSPKLHKHPEFESLKTLISQKSDKDHTHDLPEHSHKIEDTTGTLSLERVESGDKVKELLTKELCPLQHTHPGIENAIKALDKALVELQTVVTGKMDQTVLGTLQTSLNGLEDTLRAELKAIEAKIPVIPAQIRQVIGIKRIHSPFQGTIAEIAARDEQGIPVKVTITRGETELTIGDAVAVDDILSLSPASASVRIRFS